MKSLERKIGIFFVVTIVGYFGFLAMVVWLVVALIQWLGRN